MSFPPRAWNERRFGSVELRTGASFSSVYFTSRSKFSEWKSHLGFWYTMLVKNAFAKNAPRGTLSALAPVIQVAQLAGTASVPGENPGEISAPVREFFRGP